MIYASLLPGVKNVSNIGTKFMRMPKLFKLLLPLSLFALITSGFSERIQSVSNNCISEYAPALAVRAAACITCHAKISPSVITDFGYGDRYFFGKRVDGSTLGSFDGGIYGDFYGGEPNKTGWLTAEIAESIVVPQASFDFDLTAAGAKLAKANYQQPLQATSLAKYLQSLEARKAKPATVIEKKTVFIGAPSANTLEARFQIEQASGSKFKYVKNENSSPHIEGIELNSGKEYYTNTREVVCDGDLFIRGTLFLNHVTIATKSGCRIYVTGPIYLQNAVTYKKLGGSEDNTNLQLVSAEAILLGVGDKSCEANSKESSLSRRLVSGYAISTFHTRDASSKSIAPKTFGQSIYDQGKKIASLEDASCGDDKVGFSRLLLDAPQVHSRYKGKFTGVVIAEVALFRLGNGNFEFDPVFKRVPVLPRLRDSDYLQVK
jgi:hypothetical protein